MIKQVRRPLVLTVALFAVIGLIYSISGRNSDVDGITPINLNKNSDLTLKNQNIELGSGYGEESILIDNQEFTTDQNENIKDLKVEQKAPQVKAPKVEAEDTKVESFEAGPDLSGDFGVTETPFMPKMANETLKAQLGNAAWRLFHTILARYPDKPSKQEQTTLSQYIQLFAQVYPCGDCARHFQQLLQKYPPQTSSRKTAALWGCHVHNKVNERLDKPEYDCTTILEDYDCGCGDDEQEVDVTLGGKSINGMKNVEIEEEEEQYGG